MGFVVMMERGRQWPDLEGLLPWRPLQGPKAAVDSQLMPLWVNPFKHDLLTALFIYFSPSPEKAPHDARKLSAILYRERTQVEGCNIKTQLHYCTSKCITLTPNYRAATMS